MTDKTRFRPVAGTDESIQNAKKNPGYVYFASDTGKIYFDLDNDTRVAMGGSGASLLYGLAGKVEPDEYGTFTLSFDDLEGDLQPKAGDLILNDDGAFFKVIEVYADTRTILCDKIAVSGSGGGGGGGFTKRIGIKITPPRTSNLVNGQQFAISFIATSSIEEGSPDPVDDQLQIHWSLSAKENGDYTLYEKGILDVSQGVENSFDLTDKLRHSTTTKISMYAVGTNSGQSTIKSLEVVTAELVLNESKNFSPLQPLTPDKVSIECNAIGNMDKILRIYFDGNKIEERKLLASAPDYVQCPVSQEIATHGYHTVRIELYQAIVLNGQWTTGNMVKPIEFEIAVIAPGETDPVIWLGEHKEEYYNYDSIKIPFLAYDPQNPAKVEVTIQRNGINDDFNKRVVNLETGTSLNDWSYFEAVNAEKDILNRYTFSCGPDEHRIERTIFIKVVQDPNRKMELVKPYNLELSFDSAGRSNQETAVNRRRWTYEKKNSSGKVEKTYSGKFENFNWYNNGWVLGDNSSSCLRISNGAKFTIPFGKMTFNGNLTGSSNTIEMQFKVRNIQKYGNLIKNITRYKWDGGQKDADEKVIWENDSQLYTAFKEQTRYDNYDAFLQIFLPTYNPWIVKSGESEKTYLGVGYLAYDDLEFDKVEKAISLDKVICGYYSGTAANAVGFAVGPQDAFFSDGTNVVNVSFVENEMVYISMVYSKSTSGKTLIYIYNNGVITGVIESKLENPFTIDTEDIVFSSEYCDLDLYKFRIYSTDLNINDIVTNYAVDTRNVVTYDQNKLAKENTIIGEYQLDYQSMLDYNENHPNDPLMPYIIFDTTHETGEGISAEKNDRLSWSKQTKLRIGVEFVNTGLELAYRNGELERLAKADGLFGENATKEERLKGVQTYYKHHCPSWKGDRVEMAVQGTSSQFYPRRNYKLKTKDKVTLPGQEKETKVCNILLNRGPFSDLYKEDLKGLSEGTIALGQEKTRQKKWYLNNYTNGTDRWTMKVDYMESSGTYNTGFANLVANAYSKHPLQDYIEKGVVTNPDKLKADSEKVNSATLTKNVRWEDYRTSVQGFPVLAFQKRIDKKNSTTEKEAYEYLFIGMYRMNLDKGSDECYGFTPDETVGNKLLATPDGQVPPMEETTECWEFSNNARGFCSFRDPWNRMELSFKAPSGVPNEYTPNKAPVVADHVEYRYNVNEDIIDELYEMKNGLEKGFSEDAAKGIGKLLGKEYSKIGEGKTYRIPREDAEQALFKYYENWEKVNKWLWSTNTDNDFVPSQGDYQLCDVGATKYTYPNTFFILSEGKYIKDPGPEYNPEYTYYKIAEVDGQEAYVNAYVVDEAHLYKKDKFYQKVQNNYVLVSNTVFDSNIIYYELIENETYKQQTCLLVKPASEYLSDTQYYTYDGSIRIGSQKPDGLGLYTPHDCVKAVSITSEDFNNPENKGKYYIAAPVTYGEKTYEYDTKEYREAKFANELSKHFDMEYLATYFVMTEVFQCYDSRGKNAMWASWGPQTEGGEYIWYPIFYDIDTQLGINNTGIPSFEFNVDVTEAGNFSTSDSVLWNNFYKHFKQSYITNKYKHLKGLANSEWKETLAHAPMTDVNTIEKWYRTDPQECGSIAMRGDRPLVAVNLDSYFKYITITNGAGITREIGTDKKKDDWGVTGYMDNSGNYIQDTDGKFFYALQGDRSLSRRQFLTNRIEYIDSWLNVGKYARGEGANFIRGRMAANNPKETSDKWIEPKDGPYFEEDGVTKTHQFDAEYWLNLSPIRSSYVTAGDDNEAYPSIKYDGINPVKFKMNAIENGVRQSENYPEQLLYVYGIDQISDLGYMHNLYWREFVIDGKATKLTTLNLGYDGLDKNQEKWFNNHVNLPKIGGAKTEASPGLPLLKEANFSNMTITETSPTLDLTSCEKLKNFRATGSNFVDFVFADGVALDTLYLPSTITRLNLTEANLLNNLITKYEPPVLDEHGKLVAQKGLYIEKLFDGDESTNINYFSLQGGNLGYDSYKLLNKYYTLRTAAQAASSIKLTKVQWSPYIQLMKGDIYDLKHPEIYFEDDGHYGFKPYKYDAHTFPIRVLNGDLYRYDKTQKENAKQIKNIEMFESFVARDYFKGTIPGEKNPVITGFVYIDNDVPIDELDIKKKITENFPQLKIAFKNVNKVYSARFISQNEDGSWTYVENKNSLNKEPSVQKIKDGWFVNPYDLYNPKKDNYDFLGWSRTPDASGLIENSAEAWAQEKTHFSPEEYSYTYYAIFTVQQRTISFQVDGKTVGSYKITHGEYLKEPSFIPSKDESALPREERYSFLGWTDNQDKTEVTNESDAKIIEFSKIVASADYTFYGVFMKEDVYKKVTPEKFLLFEPSTYTPSGSSGMIRGYTVSAKPGLQLSGKLTLPTTYQGEPVIKVGNFALYDIDKAKYNKITHIFWDKNDAPNALRVITTGAFSNLKGFTYFELPSSIERIESSAFTGTNKSLEFMDLGHTKLKFLGDYAFSATYKEGPMIPELNLPGSLTYLGEKVFAWNDSVGRGNAIFNIVNIGSKASPSRLGYIGVTPFAQNYDQDPTTINIYIAGGQSAISPGLQASINEQLIRGNTTINYPM